MDDLRQSAGSGFGQRHATAYDGTMRLAMCLDGHIEQAAVAVRPDGDALHVEVVVAMRAVGPALLDARSG